MNKFIIKIFILFFSIMGFSQTEIASIKDSLIKKSNQEVLILFEKHEFSNYYLASGYAKILLLRASNTKDSLKIGESYYFLASVTDQKESLAYCDSSITYSKNNYSKIIPIEPLKLKGYWLYQFGEYQKAIDVFVKAYSHTNSEGDVYEKEYLQFQIAGIKSLIGQNHEALRTYKELLKSKDPETVNSSLYNVSNVFLRLKEFDSANYYSKIGIKQPIILKDSSFYYKFLAMNSIADYNLGNIDKSLKTSLEILAHFDGIELANRHYYLGKIYEKKHQNKTKLLHFRKVDSILDSIAVESRIVFQELKEVYSFLIQNSSNIDEKSSLIFKMVEFDSLSDVKSQKIKKELYNSYDLPLIKKQNEDKLLSKRFLNYTLSAAGILFFLFIYYLFKSYKNKKALNDFINKREQNIKPIKKRLKPKLLDLDPIIIEQVLTNLRSFENEKRYIDKSVTLLSLSKNFGTNSSYLSKIINSYKHVNFSTYLKEVRIENAIEELHQNPKLLRFSMEGLSDHFGFNNAESFSRAFSSYTKISTNAFIKEMKIRHNY